MSTAAKPAHPPAPELHYDWAAALLSYLVPGLGQVYQGRIGKGLLFLVCLYTLFFYGMYLGSMKNVYVYREHDGAGRGILMRLVAQSRFYGQFWIGVAAWPAIAQYQLADPRQPDKPLPVIGRLMQAPSEQELNDLQVNGDKTWDLGWVYTVIAGVLNIMVIYDALVGPAFAPAPPGKTSPRTGPANASTATAGS